MFLRPATASDKPRTNRSRKGAFTNNLAPKIKAWTPPVDEKEAPPPPPKHETEFVRWLRQQQPEENAPYRQATRDYLLEGPPYRGESTYDAKDTLKDMEAKWVPNPAKKKGCQDKTIRRGWWSAPDENVLKKLLALRRDRWRRYQWCCVDLTETQLELVQQWLGEYQKATGTTLETDEPQYDASKAKRSRHESDQDNAPIWILKAKSQPPRPMVPDTVCKVCQQSVTDQFLDCQCLQAEWRRCGNCGEKWRVDAGASSNLLLMNESLLHALGAETLRQDRKRRHDAEASLSGHSDITTPSNADETACAAENNTAENAADISIDISVDMIASALVKDRVYNSVGLLLNYARERCILSGPARSFVLRSTWATFVVMQGMTGTPYGMDWCGLLYVSYYLVVNAFCDGPYNISNSDGLDLKQLRKLIHALGMGPCTGGGYGETLMISARKWNREPDEDVVSMMIRAWQSVTQDVKVRTAVEAVCWPCVRGYLLMQSPLAS